VAATEEPLEIRLGGASFVVIMRTPGADRELTAGFLLAERIVADRTEIAAMRLCSDDTALDAALPDGPEPESANVINVWLSGPAAERAAGRLSERRHVTANSSCGVCGRRSIDDLLEGVAPVVSDVRLSRGVIIGLPARLRAAQRVFEATGGLHAAGLFDAGGRLLRVAEDVGRHNAVDKVLGGELLDGRVPSDRILFESGRTSFEIVQKAVVASVPVVASVTAPSSLAIQLALDAGITLIGFVSGVSFKIFSSAVRIAL
jgi:FdhD protein